MSNKRSTKQENRLAKNLSGGTRQIASGAFSFWKQDISSDNFLVEAKYTEALSYSIKRKYWDEIEKNAFSCGKLPLMIIEFEPNRKGLAVIRLEELLDYDKMLGDMCQT